MLDINSTCNIDGKLNHYLYLNQLVLGITLVALGNCFGDLFTDVALAKS